ncbi:hypothetical protein QBC47DRAFT_345138 [Echria macrotheca]|uniref:DUF1479-domain-containing protein n=1 Tax=Echria macrotheca TaxID=438768 RepID=A0AAJ0BB49_9PEZI|nr:hypothetical protein QBC47DRAFT_345138 [Echria macrotheca]
MADKTVPSAAQISASQFNACLARYRPCVQAISASKRAAANKDGNQKTLVELDDYRYGHAVDTFGSDASTTPMTLDEVKLLVEWKLRHGTFRPTLMKLVSSNAPATVEDTVSKAVKAYREHKDVSSAVNILTQLKGIGPATASLLLAVNFPDSVIFFADEAFYWLCGKGAKCPIKYNVKEYLALNEQAQILANRLGVRAVDVERVAYVLMRDGQATGEAPGTSKDGAEAKEDTVQKVPPKRKLSDDKPDVKAPTRRSKRNRPALPYVTMAITARGSRRPTKKKMQPLFPDPIELPLRFATLKERLVSGREETITASWDRLLCEMEKQVEHISSLGSQVIPEIDFDCIDSTEHAETFHSELKRYGVGIIRGVVPLETAAEWEDGVCDYLCENASVRTTTSAPPSSELHEVYWSPAQVKARAHPNVLAAQRFAMSVWTVSRDPEALVNTHRPVTYADRLRVWDYETPGSEAEMPLSARIDGGSVERWEPDGSAPVYKEILRGDWESYDPIDSSVRARVTSDLYHAAESCSIFRAFQGLLAFNGTPAGFVKVCPMVGLATAYILLRPLFTGSGVEEEWKLSQPQDSVLHGALPGYAQDVRPSLHPHLRLDRTLVDVPELGPGDYVIWHPDLIHSVGRKACPERHGSRDTQGRNQPSRQATVRPPSNPSITMYLPACPLTQTNALYLARQRRSFLLGHPGPDFFVAHMRSSAGAGAGSVPSIGESDFHNRPGVQDVSEAGGEDGLRAMGLFPLDEERERETRTAQLANGILFPDL